MQWILLYDSSLEPGYSPSYSIEPYWTFSQCNGFCFMTVRLYQAIVQVTLSSHTEHFNNAMDFITVLIHQAIM